MYKVCKTEKTAKRQKQFGETMMRMLETKEESQITVSDLCKEMQVPRRAFYRYFENMEELRAFLVDDALEEAFINLSGKSDIADFFRYWYENRKILTYLLKHGVDATVFARIFFFSMENKEQIEITERKMWEAYHVSGLFGILFAWEYSGMKESPEKIAEIYAGILKDIGKRAQFL